MRDVFQEITDKIANQLAQGVRPWAKPWRAGVGQFSLAMPHNVAGRNYRGANVPLLWCVSQEQGYSSPVWLTFNQALDHGGAVRKGERGTLVFFWKFDEVQDDKSGEPRRRCFAKTYSVFNAQQCDGLDLAPVEAKPLPEFERIAAAEALMAATGAKIEFGGDNAYYQPSADKVRLPVREAFKSVDGFYGTAFHELGHWTGHESRLARSFSGRFGDSAYAAEELVAELTAAMICASQGFASIEREDHAAYLAHWLKMLRHDARAFITAAGKAQAAADFILGAGAAAEAAADMSLAA